MSRVEKKSKCSIAHLSKKVLGYKHHAMSNKLTNLLEISIANFPITDTKPRKGNYFKLYVDL